MIDDKLQQLVNEQAEDEGLWFHAETAAEDYLQQALRKLHSEIEKRGCTKSQLNIGLGQL